jgi:hypothetical protein
MYISSGEVIGSIRVKIQHFVPEGFGIEPGSLLPRHGHPATLCQSTSSFQEQLKGAQSCGEVIMANRSHPLPLIACAD